MSLGCSCWLLVVSWSLFTGDARDVLKETVPTFNYPEASVEFLPLCTAGSETCGVLVLMAGANRGVRSKLAPCLVICVPTQKSKVVLHHVAIGLPLVGGFVKSASTKQSPSNTLCTVREEECTKHNSAKQPPKLSRNSLERK